MEISHSVYVVLVVASNDECLLFAFRVAPLSEDCTRPTGESSKLYLESPRSNCHKIEKIMLLPAEQLQTIVETSHF